MTEPDEAMSCADYSDAIAEFVDGTLDPARQRALERHVEGCAACRALVADLKSIQAAAFTLDRIELPGHICGRRSRRASRRSRGRQRGRLLAWPQIAHGDGRVVRRPRRCRPGHHARHLPADAPSRRRTTMRRRAPASRRARRRRRLGAGRVAGGRSSTTTRRSRGSSRSRRATAARSIRRSRPCCRRTCR